METINWEKRRYELAKEAMQGLLTNKGAYYQCTSDNPSQNLGGWLPMELASFSLGYADEMIKQLRDSKL